VPFRVGDVAETFLRHHRQGLWVPACAGTTNNNSSLRAQRSNPYRREERMDCFVASAPRNDVASKHTPAFPRRPAPEFCNEPFAQQKSEGVGNAGCPLHPQPRVQKVVSTRVSTADTPEHPAFPHAMVLTVSFVLSQATGLVCHLRRRNEAPLMSPVGQEAPSAALTPASGRQDHTTSPSAGHIIRPRAA
jgi:hypothetical protein